MDFIAMAETLEAQAASLRRHAAELANDGQQSLPLDDSQWAPWEGGDEPPGDGKWVDLKFRNGTIEIGCPADVYNWTHTDPDDCSEIVAWRFSARQPAAE